MSEQEPVPLLGRDSEGQFDICVLHHSLAGVPNPLKLLRVVWSSLKAGGTVLIVSTLHEPNGRRFSNATRIEVDSRDLFHFSPSNLQSLLYRCSFSAVHMGRHRKATDLEHLTKPPNELRQISRPRGVIARVVEYLPRSVRNRPFIVDTGAVAIASRDSTVRSRLRSLSVILPVYNERDTFPTVVQALLAKRITDLDMEIVVVESNSSDGTREEVLKLKDHPSVKMVLQDEPRGKGNAVREGIENASGDIILIQDGDLEYDLWDYEPLLLPILENRSAFTLGLRRSGGTGMRSFVDRPLLAAIINLGHILLTGLFNLLYGQRLKDPWTMFKVFRSDCVEGLTFECDRFDFDIELVIKLIKRGFVPAEIPVHYRSRSYSEGKKVTFSEDPVRILKAMLKFRFLA